MSIKKYSAFLLLITLSLGSLAHAEFRVGDTVLVLNSKRVSYHWATIEGAAAEGKVKILRRSLRNVLRDNVGMRKNLEEVRVQDITVCDRTSDQEEFNGRGIHAHWVGAFSNIESGFVYRQPCKGFYVLGTSEPKMVDGKSSDDLGTSELNVIHSRSQFLFDQNLVKQLTTPISAE